MLHKIPHEASVIIDAGAPSKERLGNTLKVCVWNMQKCKRKLWEKDFLNFCAGADLFLVQEIGLTERAKSALPQTHMFWRSAISFFNFFSGSASGIAIGSAAKPLKTAHKRSVSEPFFNTPKMLMSCVYKAGGKEILVINVHAINFKGLPSFIKNMLDMQALLAGFEGPVIIGGDFNTWSRGRTAALKNFARDARLEFASFNPDERAAFFGKKMDFIMTRGFNIKSASALTVKSSDHNPLFAELELSS